MRPQDLVPGQVLPRALEIPREIELDGEACRAQGREVGQQANTLKTRIEAALGKRQQVLRSALLEGLAFREAIDITLPGRPIARGSLHPLTATRYEIIEGFQHLGVSVAEGREVELD